MLSRASSRRDGVRVVATVLVLGLAACSAADEPGAEVATDDPAVASTPGAGSEGTPPAATATNGRTDGTETDVDCGGATAPKCAVGKRCAGAADCESGVCDSGTCAAPRPDDGVKNGDETDVDCGGATAPKCAVGKACAAHADCASDGCDDQKLCAVARSCTQRHGGRTCGAGETGQPGAQHESCCTAIDVPRPNAPFRLDKYVVTAGRMRAFIERVNGDVRGFVSSLPASDARWKPAWSASVSSNMAEANVELGPYGSDGTKRGCWMGGQGARTYWMPDDVNQSFANEVPHKYGKDVLDEKALQCVSFYMLQAFCIWDGGRLATSDEIDAAWGPATYPWGNQAWNPDLAVHKFTYGWPENRLDNTAYIAAPGRRPLGNGPFGHADLGGLVIEVTSTSDAKGDIRWSKNGSWENHAIGSGGTFTTKERAYWASGGRCTRLPAP